MDTASPLPAAVLLDRDGVINEDSPAYIKTPDEWLPIDGSIEAIATLHRAGIPVAICTNQAGIARGLFNHQSLNAIHTKLLDLVTRAGGHITLIRYCAHGPTDGCRCRKPATGMLEDACRALGVEPERCWFVGDSEKDLQAAHNVGCVPILVRTGNGRDAEQKAIEGITTFDNLSKAVNSLNV